MVSGGLGRNPNPNPNLVACLCPGSNPITGLIAQNLDPVLTLTLTLTLTMACVIGCHREAEGAPGHRLTGMPLQCLSDSTP